MEGACTYFILRTLSRCGCSHGTQSQPISRLEAPIRRRGVSPWWISNPSLGAAFLRILLTRRLWVSSEILIQSAIMWLTRNADFQYRLLWLECWWTRLDRLVPLPPDHRSQHLRGLCCRKPQCLYWVVLSDQLGQAIPDELADLKALKALHWYGKRTDGICCDYFISNCPSTSRNGEYW